MGPDPATPVGDPDALVLAERSTGDGESPAGTLLSWSEMASNEVTTPSEARCHTASVVLKRRGCDRCRAAPGKGRNVEVGSGECRATVESRPPWPWGDRVVVLCARRSSYLVDPASSHMLVSKTKPCMCKYERICTVKLRMAH